MPDFDILRTQFEDHCRENQVSTSVFSASLKSVRREICLIKDNHLSHIQKDITDLKVEVSNHGRDIKWLTKVQWFMLTSNLGSLAGILYLTISNALT